MADRRKEITSWLQRHDREFVVVLGEESRWWTEADVDAVIAGQTQPQAPARPAHYPEMSTARPRPLPNRAGANRGAVVTPPPDQEPVDDNSGAPVRPSSSTSAGGTADPVATTSRTGRLLHPVAVDVGEVAPCVGNPRGRDVLAEGLAHRDPDVVAAAQVARLAIDRLITQLQRHHDRGATP